MKKEIELKNINYVCPQCFKTDKVSARIILETDDESLDLFYENENNIIKICTNCNTEMFAIDKNIFPYIIKLNDLGLETIFSCEGHGYDSPAYIAFNSKCNSLIEKLDPPELWYFDTPSKTLNPDIGYVLRPISALLSLKYFDVIGTTYEEYHKKELDNLKNWPSYAINNIK